MPTLAKSRSKSESKSKSKSKSKSRQAVPSARPASADGFVTLDGREMYRIADYDQLPPFLMSIVSDSDHWMYLSSTGGLTAGRVNESGALFPYVTDDKLHQCFPFTGPHTLVRLRGAKQVTIWEPFRDAGVNPAIRRNLYKAVVGNSVTFEEINTALGLTFRYTWANSEQFGFVRTCTLTRHEKAKGIIALDIIDGILNLMPAAIELGLQQGASCLANAYTRCDVDAKTGLGLIGLQALIVDQAKPAVALRATTVWSRGLPSAKILLSQDQFPAFRAGKPISAEATLKGRRGAFLISAALKLKPGQSISWDLVADVDRDHIQVAALQQTLAAGKNLRETLAADIDRGTQSLRRNIASADGLQSSADRVATAHHFANVLFNNMRGGVFADNHTIPTADFAAFVHERNHEVHARAAAFLGTLQGDILVDDLLAKVGEQNDTDLLRLAYEYLPITFSRRHGDPSRPWNRFTIKIKNKDGTRALAYQGNWRDIFQNWEALSLSFPEFIESIIAKFVNASTMDGFNPYRVTREGIDWEAPEPENPWSNIGYWGDHQIIYLLRLMEASHRYHPGRLETLLARPLFSYADVPYRIKDYAEIVQHPRDTIRFDRDHAKRVDARVAKIGPDGKLVHTSDGEVYHVTLAEKILVAALSKLSNLVPDGGIWMNTQRPEWNDANNALVGNGISVVTLCYLRRYIAFTIDLLQRADTPSIPISTEVSLWAASLASILNKHLPLLEKPTLSDRDRRQVLDQLGFAFEAYRTHVYQHAMSGQKPVPTTEMTDLLKTALQYVDHGIRANRRKDGLYHAYNLLDLETDPAGARVDYLYEMLEGQVAVLSSGLLTPKETHAVLKALAASAMYRKDQNSYMLYPNRALPSFLEKNVIPAKAVKDNPLLVALLAAGDDSIIARDATGAYRFAGSFRIADDLAKALDKLAKDARWTALVAAQGAAIQKIFADIFNFRAFTGRSGTMYGYEGLGCIYWHMVAKLAIAAQESALHAAGTPDFPALADDYYTVRAGLGFNKSARVYGAFPTDPYSHTPGHSGAQQPGMTGQVKEEVISRWGELGLIVADGQLAFRPMLLRASEFPATAGNWSYFDFRGQPKQLALSANSIGFTFCATPILYHLTAGAPSIRVISADGTTQTIAGPTLPPDLSRALFSRTGAIARIEVEVPRSALKPG